MENIFYELDYELFCNRLGFFKYISRRVFQSLWSQCDKINAAQDILNLRKWNSLSIWFLLVLGNSEFYCI